MEQITQTDSKSLKKASPKDFFLHLFTVGLLYYSAVSFLVLVFELVDKYFPETLNAYGYSPTNFADSTIRFAISSLVVLFPLFLYLNNYLHKQYEKDADKKHLRIRKWLVYLTLFISAITLAGDLIATINKFLDGFPPISFILKAASILIVAGGVFYYYLVDIRAAEKQEEAHI
ncbi:MAG: hypothetical protein LiPW15_264 [Parcubacteria group bacterium LiPW_15]|nr:MAG: hypothetical protein LiPW15_264 [Parcubacteria group bacterium LiPW_15]